MNTEEKVVGCIFGFVILGFLFIFIFSIFFSVFTPTEGSHTGYVTAVEKNGVIWKTGRAYIKTDLSSSQEDYYCVTDNSVYEELKKVQTDKEKVTVEFSAPLIVGNWDCGGENSIINKVTK